ncbi:MAG: sulfotransferase domain-containing protein [Cyanobacteria bacterium J06649_4]
MRHTQPDSRKQALKDAIKVLVGKESAARRELTVRPDDVFITSYPKSGNTWTRFLLANLLWPEGDTDFVNIEKRVPDIYKQTDRALLACDRPRYLKSHEYFDPRYPKILYIVRDPRSVLVSYYNYEMRWATCFNAKTTYYDFAKVFLDGKLGTFVFGNWQQNVSSWLGVYGQKSERLCCIKYEDLLYNGPKTLSKVVDFIGLERSQQQLEQALDRSSLERMKALEKASAQQGKQWEKSARNKDIPFVRAGKSKEWCDVLDYKTLALIEERYGRLMVQLGYDIS